MLYCKDCKYSGKYNENFCNHPNNGISNVSGNPSTRFSAINRSTEQSLYEVTCGEGYTCIPELRGDNLQDLSDKLDTFLTSLVNTLNSVTTECECCGGTGHIIQTAKSVFKSILNK